jgi:hypothetical protein
MTIKVEETQESRRLRDGYEPNQKSIEIEFLAWADDYAETDTLSVESAVLAVLTDPLGPFGDPLYGPTGLRLQTLSIDPLTNSIFRVIAPYGVFSPPQPSTPAAYFLKVGFSTAGTTEHIDTAYATTRHNATGQLVPDFGNWINWDQKSNRAKGIKTSVGQLAFRVTTWFDPAAWDAIQWLNLTDLSDTVNLFAWHGWPKGYVLFEHAECSEYELGKGVLTPVTFHFKARRPEIVSKPEGIFFVKPPWNYVSDVHGMVADSTPPKTLRPKLLGTVSQVIKGQSDFALLGMGS